MGKACIGQFSEDDTIWPMMLRNVSGVIIYDVICKISDIWRNSVVLDQLFSHFGGIMYDYAYNCTGIDKNDRCR